MNQKHGKVFFIGAGPGNAGLLTLRGLEALKASDLVIYDRLISPEILELIPESTPLHCAEELPGCHPERIENIVKLMVEATRNGKTVGRLKGGDPLLFGRGHEEIDPLCEKKIPFEIIPGVTAALGATAFAGFPLTDRDLSSAVAFITGHEKPGKTESMIDWANLAHFKGSLVFYMGIKRASAIQENLTRNGMPEDTPTAVVSNATLYDQKSFATTLGQLTETINQNKIQPPSMIVIGKVARRLGDWNWSEKLPLSGASIAIARPKGQETAFASALRKLGASVSLITSMEIIDPPSMDSLDQSIYNLSSFHWIVFTSANGVRKFIQRVLAIGKDLRVFGQTKIACIGKATAHALKEFHLDADMVPPVFNSESVVKELAPLIANQQVLLARAVEGRPELAQELSKFCKLTEAFCYAQQKPTHQQMETYRNLLVEKHFDYLVATSPNVAKLFISLLPCNLAKTPSMVSISPLTDAEFQKAGLINNLIAHSFDSEGILEVLIGDWLQKKMMKKTNN